MITSGDTSPDEFEAGREAYRRGVNHYTGASAAWRAGWVSVRDEAERHADEVEADVLAAFEEI